MGFIRWDRRKDFEQIDFARNTKGIWIDGSEKLVAPPTEGVPSNCQLALYDIHANPVQKTNWADKRPERVAAIGAR